MVLPDKQRPFLQALGIRRGDAVFFVGAGGKTSLIFHLAQEACQQGFRVLVTTSTRMFIPDSDQYDSIDLSGKLFSDRPVTEPGIYVGGLPDSVEGKMTGVRDDLLTYQQKKFDIVLVEADGSAGKPLKGWKNTEPVVTEMATKTVGLLDIQAIGKIIDESLVHRLDIFSLFTGCQAGKPIAIGHLLRVICHDEGLFAQALGEEILFINKVECDKDCRNVDKLKSQLENLKIIAGSVQQGTIYG
jgi:probable selenium-dependent hydroxylase accessory protein YqeC